MQEAAHRRAPVRLRGPVRWQGGSPPRSLANHNQTDRLASWRPPRSTAAGRRPDTSAAIPAHLGPSDDLGGARRCGRRRDRAGRRQRPDRDSDAGVRTGDSNAVRRYGAAMIRVCAALALLGLAAYDPLTLTGLGAGIAAQSFEVVNGGVAPQKLLIRFAADRSRRWMEPRVTRWHGFGRTFPALFGRLRTLRRRCDRSKVQKIRAFPWCCRGGLNSRPPPYQGGALPLSYGSAGRTDIAAGRRAAQGGLESERA